ncbi:MAG: hypothetical protein JXA60_12155 [Candidatus Coatesbacteria bacterium]|nr:hypothetical protein [Candidatus Coatesbacteria bacterium]
MIGWLIINLIQVSIDGPKEIHDRYRTSKDGQSTYEIIFNNLLSLDRKYPSYLRINGSIVITLAPPFVLKEIFNWASTEFLKHFSFDYISWVITTVSLKNINPEKYWDLNFDVLNRDIEELKVYLLDKIDNKELSSNELSFFKSWILDSLLPIYKRDLRDISDNYKPGLLGCIPGNDRVFVTSNGDYYTCERVNEAFKIGSVETGINLDMVNKLQLQIQDFLSFCESCWAKRICQTCLSSLEKEKTINKNYHLESCPYLLEIIESNLSLFCEIMESDSDFFKQFTFI